MSLSVAQNAVLKAAMLADANVIAIVGRDQAVADYYNALSATTIWRNNISASEIVAAVVMSEYVALTALKQAGLTFLLQPLLLDATSANIRNAFATIFAAGQTLTALTALAQRSATRFEALAGFITVAAPSNLSSVVGRVLTDVEVYAARNS